ncbi:substrate-binding domain-containing protein [Anabaena sp. UHCC 0253]|uniref:substrate-binding domain-containing protein n=1 Tax=Anabaena sp. UHCC 0253 TaxID=2590019 RepID=UPI00352AC4FA
MAKTKKDSVITNLALLLAVPGVGVAIAVNSMVANLLISAPVHAEPENKSPVFSLPSTVESGTVVKIDGSINFIIVNQSLKENFEKQFSGTQVEIGINGNEDAVKSVLDGRIDIAALGRQLTAAEKAQGLEQVLVLREKIAVVVGMDNPFQGSLTTEQFAKIFRGEITDWSEVGNAKGKIRFIDRPSISDTRNSFTEYPAFKSGELLTGANSVQMIEDSTTDIIKELGKDGISYVLANQVSRLQDVRVLKVQNYLPDNPKYPFSQSFVYVYKQNPSPKVAGFLGFVVAKPGQESIKAARDAESLAIAASALQTFTSEVITPTTTPTTTPIVTPTAVTQNPSLPPIPANLVTPAVTETGGETQLINPLDNPSMITKNLRFFLLLPLLLIAGLSSFLPLWLRRKKRLLNQTNDSIPEEIPTTTVSDAEAIASITNNHHNGHNGTNHYQEDISLEVTAINNVATIDIPQTSTPSHQTPAINDIELDYGEVVWDTEDPVIVVNNHYPQIPNRQQPQINADISNDEFTNSLLEPPAPAPTKNITSLSELLGITPSPIQEDHSISLSELLDTPPAPIQEDHALSEILDTPPTVVNQPPEEENLLDDLPLELGEALNAIDSETQHNTSAQAIAEEILPTPLPPTATDEDIAIELDAEIEAWTNINQINVDGNTRIIFTPRTPKWAYVSWYISANHLQTLQNQGFTILVVRLYDVTNLDISYQRPQLVQEYECETAIYDRYIPIPQGERDYMTEIGYLTPENRWLCLARSGTVRIFSRPCADFWFVVDAELVIHGATEQGATVTIDGQKVNIKPDGTFKLTIPFVDNLVDYQMTAISANKEDTKTIQKKFSQE